MRYQFFNDPANVSVEVRTVGPREVMPNQPLIWDVLMENSSTIELSDFYFRAIMPYHAVRLESINTGRFNQSLRYSVMFRTNQVGEWRVAYDNLSSSTNNDINMSGLALGLRNDERVTEIMFLFGTVREGFASTVNPRIEGTVNSGLSNGYEFVLRVDAGGTTGNEWVVSNSTWRSRVWTPNRR